MGRARQQRGADAPPPPPQFRFKWRFSVVGFAVALAVAVGFWAKSRPPRTEAAARARLGRVSPAPGELNLVVVTLDTLRADRLGCYGFPGVETPAIDALAREGILFEHVTSTAPLTFPSHASIFTGLLPPHHGVRDNGGFFLEDAKTTLAERLSAVGFETGAFVGAWVLESRWGLAQGFDHYSDRFDLSQYKVISLGTVQKKGEQVMGDALKWIDGVRGRRFFAWIHLYDPHTPYDPPEPFSSRYPGQPYLGEIAYTDHVVGTLVEHLRSLRLIERTILVVTADHGESLGEHGESTHAYYVYDSTTAVPLIFRTPWGLTGRSRTQVSSVDIFPTLLDLLGLPPQEGIDGASLARALFDPRAELARAAYSETYFPRFHFGWQHLRALRDGRYRFVEAPRPELYDLVQDPAEEKNVYKANSLRAEEMRRRLESMVQEAGGAAPQRQALDPETLQRLAALGYVGNVADVDPRAVLPDPKDKIRLFGRLNAAKAAAEDEHLDDAIAEIRQVLAEDPNIMDAYVTLGNWLNKSGRHEEAIEAYKQALSLKPDDEVAMLNLAGAYRSRARPGDDLAAVEIFKGALKKNPRNPQAWYQLASLYLDMDRGKDGENTFRQAVEANPRMGAGWNALGAFAYQRRDLAGAERLVRKGLELEPEVRTGRFNLARILDDRGRSDEAERLYREELETYPDHGRARFNLAQLLGQRGDLAGYLRELRTGIEKAPESGACFFFLAREELNAGNLDAAADLARRGLDVDSRSEVAPLGHYVLADVYNRKGQTAEAQQEVAKARRLEATLRARPLPRL